jgi:hypothetical protein
MQIKDAMFLGLLGSVGTFISLTFSGSWIGQSEMDVTNSLVAFKQANILGIWSVSVPNISFFVTGIKFMTSLDFAFLQGQMGILQWFLWMILGFGIVWGIFTVVIVSVSGLFGRR